MSFKTEPGFHDGAAPRRAAHAAGDAFYAMLIEAHRGLSDAQSELLNARLVLLLAGQVGELTLLGELLRLARRGVAPNGGGTAP